MIRRTNNICRLIHSHRHVMELFWWLIFFFLFPLTNLTPCEREADCTGNFMTCRDNICVCDEWEERIIDALIPGGVELRVACRGVALVGEKCDGENLVFCTEYSVCEKGVCRCAEGFSEYEMIGECRVNFKGRCDDHALLCNPQQFIRCDDKRCECLPGLQWVEELSTCVSAIGSFCDLKISGGVAQKCGLNATCVPEPGADYWSESEEDILGICNCDRGYTQSQNNNHSCQLIYGNPCLNKNKFNNKSNYCEEGYECHIPSNTCRCNEADYLYEEPFCRRKVGIRCNNNDDEICSNHAHCNNGVCACFPNFITTPTGGCALDHGAINCSQRLPCYEGLVCLNNTCSCPQGQILQRENCRIGHGIIGECEGNNKNSGKFCVQHAHCSPEGLCLCDDDFEVDRENGLECIRGYGSPCNKNDLCPQSMECSIEENICDCVGGSGMIYDPSKGECLVAEGEPCSYAKGRKCIGRAFCGSGDICKCYLGYVSTSNGDCWISFGEFCEEEGGVPCGEGLECKKNEGDLYSKCSCDSGMEWDENEEICKLLLPAGKIAEQSTRESTDAGSSISTSLTWLIFCVCLVNSVYCLKNFK